MLVVLRRAQTRKIAKMLQLPQPDGMLDALAASVRKLPNGDVFMAANSATILAFYGRFEDAERVLSTVSRAAVPPIVQSQESAARAAIAFARGDVSEGLDHSIAARAEAEMDVTVPGSATSTMALRTYRNLGMALAGRDSDATADELREAFTKLPLVGQIIAAWGLAVIHRRKGDVDQHLAMVRFVETRAPHFRPVLDSMRNRSTPA
jgi:hypothetical protein